MFSQVSLSLKIKQLQISIMTTKESYGINAFSSELVLAIEQLQRLFTIYMVWTNSGLINFVVESRLPFVQISFIPIEKRLRRRETGVKDGFEEWNTNFRLEHSVGKNRTTLSDVPLSPDIFRVPRSTFVTYKRFAVLFFLPSWAELFEAGLR